MTCITKQNSVKVGQVWITIKGTVFQKFQKRNEWPWCGEGKPGCAVSPLSLGATLPHEALATSSNSSKPQLPFLLKKLKILEFDVIICKSVKILMRREGEASA